MGHDATTLGADTALLRSHGQRLTPQRLLVLEIMQRSHGHVTVETVVQHAKERGDQLSVASAYRILAWLREQALVSMTDVGTGSHVFEYLGHGEHHHLVCQRCDRQIDLPFDVLAPLVETLRADYGFEAHITHQAILGICRECRTRPAT